MAVGRTRPLAGIRGYDPVRERGGEYAVQDRHSQRDLALGRAGETVDELLELKRLDRAQVAVAERGKHPLIEHAAVSGLGGIGETGLFADVIPGGRICAEQLVSLKCGAFYVVSAGFALGVFQLGHGAAGDPFVDVPALGVHADLDLCAV